MSIFDERRCLPVLTLLVVFAAATRAQTPAQPPVPAPAQPAVQAPVQPSNPTQPPAQPGTTPPSAVPPPTTTVPASPLSPEELGDTLASHQRYQAAIAAYTKEANPSAALWNKMGIAYQMMFNLKDATRCYNASLKLDPRNAQVLNNLATVYDSLKQYGTAERYYRKALKVAPKSALILRNLGSNQLTQHKYKKGWDTYRLALAIDPQIFASHSGISVENPASTQDRGAMHYYMAKGCVSAGNSECAIQNLRMALNEGYTNPKKIAADASFASLHELPAFQQMIAAQSAP